MSDTRIPARRLGWSLGLTLVITAVAAVLLLRPESAAPPDIQGAVLPKPRDLPGFELTDHQGRPFTPRDLEGGWHLVGYGFTHCPDICPTTLYEMAEFRRQLEQRDDFGDLSVLYYTIDPRRDTLDRLADYVPWFHKDFVGLRAPDDEAANTFETALGITASVAPAESPGDYNVTHGLMLYLIDDQGRFRATLAPTSERDGSQHYEPDRLLRDYLAIRRWQS